MESTNGTPTTYRALVLDDEQTTLAILSRLLDGIGWEAIRAKAIDEARSIMQVIEPDALIADVHLSGEDGLDFVRECRSRGMTAGIVVISAEDTETLANKAVNSGADYFLSKPIAPSALSLTLGKVLELGHTRSQTADLRRELAATIARSAFPEVVTHSDAMIAVLKLVEKVGPRDLAVLVCGESGTGKELIARAIHDKSARASGPYVELNCAALPPNLVESELFGHERGAFTGAVASRTGKIEQASGGTLFLDEIGELPMEIQPKLLRALQEKRIVRVGGKEAIHCDFRLVSATNRDLVDEVREGRFREDLFYRVAVFPIKLPPLRQRMEDLDLLLLHFLNQEGGGTAVAIDDEARQILHRYEWPGNVRELKNFAQAILLFSEGGRIDRPSVEAYFGARMTLLPKLLDTVDTDAYRRPVRTIAEIERDEVEYALAYHEGNVSEASRSLKMGRATLYKFIKRENIDLESLAEKARIARSRDPRPDS